MSGLTGGLPGGRRRLRDAINGPVAQAGQDILEVLAQVDLEPPTGFDDGHDGRHFGPRLGTPQMQPVLASERDGPHSPFAPVGELASLVDSGSPVDPITCFSLSMETRHSRRYGDIRKFADNTRFHLRAAYQIAAVLFVDYGAHGETIDILIKRLEQGLPAEALPLLDLPVSVERGDYLALYENGAKAVTDVWKFSDDQLVQMLGQQKAGRLIAKRPS